MLEEEWIYITNGVSFLQTTKIIVLNDPIVMVIPFLHTGRKRAPLLPETEEPMTTIDFITALFLPIRSINFLFPEFQAAYRAPSLTLVVLGRNNPSLYAVNGRPVYVHLNGLAIVRLK